MSYDYQVNGYWRVKADKVYPWPCKDLPDRTLEIFADDVLTKLADGTFVKHTGLMTLGHVIPDADVVHIESTANLHVGSSFI